jgi:hypothetical protein
MDMPQLRALHYVIDILNRKDLLIHLLMNLVILFQLKFLEVHPE